MQHRTKFFIVSLLLCNSYINLQASQPSAAPTEVQSHHKTYAAVVQGATAAAEHAGLINTGPATEPSCSSHPSAPPATPPSHPQTCAQVVQSANSAPIPPYLAQMTPYAGLIYIDPSELTQSAPVPESAIATAASVKTLAPTAVQKSTAESSSSDASGSQVTPSPAATPSPQLSPLATQPNTPQSTPCRTPEPHAAMPSPHASGTEKIRDELTDLRAMFVSSPSAAQRLLITIDAPPSPTQPKVQSAPRPTTPHPAASRRSREQKMGFEDIYNSASRLNTTDCSKLLTALIGMVDQSRGDLAFQSLVHTLAQSRTLELSRLTLPNTNSSAHPAKLGYQAELVAGVCKFFSGDPGQMNQRELEEAVLTRARNQGNAIIYTHSPDAPKAHAYGLELQKIAEKQIGLPGRLTDADYQSLEETVLRNQPKPQLGKKYACAAFAGAAVATAVTYMLMRK